MYVNAHNACCYNSGGVFLSERDLRQRDQVCCRPNVRQAVAVVLFTREACGWMDEAEMVVVQTQHEVDAQNLKSAHNISTFPLGPSSKPFRLISRLDLRA